MIQLVTSRFNKDLKKKLSLGTDGVWRSPYGRPVAVTRNFIQTLKESPQQVPVDLKMELYQTGVLVVTPQADIVVSVWQTIRAIPVFARMGLRMDQCTLKFGVFTESHADVISMEAMK